MDRFVFSGMFEMQSIKDVGDVFAPVWTSVAGSLAGQDVSLDDVEKGQGAPLVGLLPSYHDPRIHSSVICASVSCPDLSPTAFTAANEDELLNARVSAWLAHPTKGLAVADGQITASKIFDCKAAILSRLVAPSTSLTRKELQGTAVILTGGDHPAASLGFAASCKPSRLWSWRRN